MKKIAKVLIVTICLILCVSVTACGKKDATVEGSTWKIVSVTDPEGNVMSGDQIESVMGSTTYEFKASGVWVINSADQSIEGTWAQDGNTVTMTSADGTAYSGTISGDEMKAENAGGVTVFKKQ